MENFIEKLKTIIATISMDYESEKELNGEIDFVEDTLVYLNEQLTLLEQEQEIKSILNDFILLAKQNYKSKDGTIEKGVEVDGKFYAPKNNLPNK